MGRRKIEITPIHVSLHFMLMHASPPPPRTVVLILFFVLLLQNERNRAVIFLKVLYVACFLVRLFILTKNPSTLPFI